MLDKNSSIPLWEQLDGILREKIDNGIWQSGDVISSENELSKEFKISRMTVRSVITRLVQEGLLYRVPGKGTFVSEPKIHTKPLSKMGIREQLEEEGYQISTKVIENLIKLPSDRIAKKFGMIEKEPIYFVERIRYIKEKPLSIHRTYIKESIIGTAIDFERLEKEQLCKILEDDFDLIPTKTQETLEMVYATNHQAELLGIKESHPLLYLQDVRYKNSTIIEYSEVFFRGDQIRINLEL